MNGYTIFTHSLRQVVGNIGMAVRVSWWFWLMLVILLFGYGVLVGVSNSMFVAVILGVALFVFILWGVSLIAVAWHRYILLEERPGGVTPYRPDLDVWGYFWNMLGIAIITIIIVLALSLLFALVMGGIDILQAISSTEPSFSNILIQFLFTVISTVIYLRMALVLPGVALQAGMTLGHAWRESKPYTGSIIVLAITLALLNILAMAVLGGAMVAFADSPGAVFVVSLAVLAFQWFYFMLNISVLSTLFGHIVQKREVY